MDYNDKLKNEFKDLVINIVKHDTSATGLPCYIEVHLGKSPKNKESLVLDLGNYIYRTTGLSYQMCPEFRGRGKTTTLRWFMSWRDVQPILANIYKAVTPDRKPIDGHLPYEFSSLIIQNSDRGVHSRGA